MLDTSPLSIKSGATIGMGIIGFCGTVCPIGIVGCGFVAEPVNFVFCWSTPGVAGAAQRLFTRIAIKATEYLASTESVSTTSRSKQLLPVLFRQGHTGPGC
jgi:hypothetical protein